MVMLACAMVRLRNRAKNEDLGQAGSNYSVGNERERKKKVPRADKRRGAVQSHPI
jgi:hypothetical protein